MAKTPKGFLSYSLRPVENFLPVFASPARQIALSFSGRVLVPDLQVCPVGVDRRRVLSIIRQNVTPFFCRRYLSNFFECSGVDRAVQVELKNQDRPQKRKLSIMRLSSGRSAAAPCKTIPKYFFAAWVFGVGIFSGCKCRSSPSSAAR